MRQMKQRRLCRLERISLFNLYALIGSVEQLIPKWYRYESINDKEKEAFDKALVSLWEAIRLYEKKLSLELQILLKTEVKCVQSVVLPLEEIAKIREAQDITKISVDRESLNTLASKALNWCDPCDEKDYINCELRKVFRSLEVEPLSFECDGTCEYLYKKKSGKKGLSTVEDFLEYCKAYHFIPTPFMIEKFEALIMYQKCYWEKNVLPEKVFRKFLEYIVPALFKIKDNSRV